MASDPRKPVVILARTAHAAEQFALARGIISWIWPARPVDVVTLRDPEVYVLPSFDAHQSRYALGLWVAALLTPAEGVPRYAPKPPPIR